MAMGMSAVTFIWCLHPFIGNDPIEIPVYNNSQSVDQLSGTVVIVTYSFFDKLAFGN